MNLVGKTLSMLLSVTLITATFNSAQAAMIPNEVAIANLQGPQQNAGTALLAALQRSDLKQQLADMGVDTAVLESRINMMTDEEIARLNQRIDELPAGGDLLGVILVIFIVFVITDVIGATDIFPFIKPVN